jgi:RNA polymerase sigma factor (sigma-70 family)
VGEAKGIGLKEAAGRRELLEARAIRPPSGVGNCLKEAVATCELIGVAAAQSRVMPASPDELIPTRRSLLSRLKDWDDQESWREFFNTYWKLIYGVALKAGLCDAEAQDVVQDTVVAVARKMQDFRYDPAAGSFKNWLLVITRRRIADHQRKQYRQPLLADCGASTGTETDGLERIPAPVDPGIDAIWDAEWEKNLLEAARRTPAAWKGK